MKLSDFKDEKAIEVMANLIEPISNISATVKKVQDECKDKMTVAQLVAIAIKSNVKDVMAMLAILNDVPIGEYHCTVASVLSDAMDMFSDKQLMELFGLQSEMLTSSRSASGSIEVQK